jgi:SAM-dependent methyltransferase
VPHEPRGGGFASWFRWATRGRDRERPAVSGGEAALVSKGLAKFLSALSSRPSPALVDLGPVVGANVSFLGERLGCKLRVEDLYADIERHAREGRTAALPEFFASRFPQPEGSVDGILCWDCFDFLERPAARVLARELTRVLRPGGVLFGLFGAVANPDPSYTRFTILDERTLQPRTYAAARPRQPVLVNRDITKLFEHLRVAESFLLQTRLRETVFRKPDASPAAPA